MQQPGTISATVWRMTLLCSLVIVGQIIIAAFPGHFLSFSVVPERPPPAQSRPALVRLRLPVVCSHRGVNDVNATESIASSLLSLCVTNGVCCVDYDVGVTSDRVLVAGKLKQVTTLFSDQIAPEDEKRANTLTTQDFTIQEIKRRDPEGRTLVELRSLVDVAVALRGMGMPLLVTFDPKASTQSLQTRVASMVAEMIRNAAGSASTEPFVIIASTPAISDAINRPIADSPDSTERPRAIRLGMPLMDKDLQMSLAQGDSETVLSQALRTCSKLCSTSAPSWATFVLPSVQFLRTCSSVRYQSIHRFGVDFYLKWYGKCRRATGAKHMAWIINSVRELRSLPPPYEPDFVFSDAPVTLQREFRALTENRSLQQEIR